MKIYGAGMAGLLAANMLRRHKPVIYEAQESLPNNHAALLRFRTDKVSNATHIPFKKVLVRKAIKYKGQILTEPSIPACNEYSLKVTGNAMGRSIWNLDPVTRYIAPSDFISQCASSLNIKYNHPLNGDSNIDLGCISTIPMPVLMDIFRWKDKPEFNYSPIWTFSLDLGEQFDIYQTIYDADESSTVYRYSITGRHLIIEFASNPKIQSSPSSPNLVEMVANTMKDFGIDEQRLNCILGRADFQSVQYQKYGKLLPIDENLRKEFILAMSDKYQIYSLGRFATWRQLLMDDVVNDVKIIENFITERDSYSRRLST